MLSPKQIKNLKEQLLSQIQNLPEDKKEEARNQIESLSPQSLELMLKQQGQGEQEQSIFRAIASKQIPSSIIEETDQIVAVLEINPISKGHIIIIPKTPIKTEKEIPEEIKDKSKNLAKTLASKLKAKSIEIQSEEKFGEAIINLIPIYDQPLNLKSKRYRAKKEELEEIINKIKEEEKKEIEKIKIERKIQDKPLKLKRKIP